MAGTLITVIPKTDFEFTPVGTTASETIIARALNAVPYREGVLVARVHSKSSTTSAGQTLSVVIRAVAPSVDDPSVDFELTGSDVASVSFNCSATYPCPMMAVGAFVAPFAPQLRVLLRYSQATQNDVFTASISVDLVMRE